VNRDEHTLIFVYGTLKRGGSNHPCLAGEVFVGEARTTPGFRLHDLGDFPGMIVATDDTTGVAGEIWSVQPAALARLDALEGIAEGLYRRERVALQPPFADRHVETYLYNLTTAGRPAIPDGVWRE
jgi:gamma-glutamylcyclotransferase (GGCT)/AIG2-like uncharacterized protein YtfP